MTTRQKEHPFALRTLPILFGIFIISVLIRVPNLDRPLSKHHEFCTAVALRVVTLWSDQGISTFNYNPVMTYGNPADKYINNHANTSGQMLDKEGNYYYVSHPPFAYYLPYGIFTIFGHYPSVLGIQLINMMLHFLSALFVYFTVCLLAFNRVRSKLYVPALVAFLVYLFNPATLWFQSNVYMSDTLVSTLFIIGVYTALKLIIRRRFFNKKYLFFFALVSFLMTYTSWLGILFCFSVVVYGIYRMYFMEKNFYIIIAISFFSTLLALVLTFWQYGSINGYEAYVSELASRLSIRGSMGMSEGILSTFKLKLWEMKNVAFNYIIHYLPLYSLIFGFSILVITRAKLRIVFTKNGYRFLWLSLLPIILLHGLLLNYSGQDFTVMYAAFFFSVFTGILYDKLKEGKAVKERVQVITISMVLLSQIFLYYYVNRPGDISFKGDRYISEYEMANEIKRTATHEEVIFIKGITPSPQLVYYLHRNVKRVANKEEAHQFLKTTGNEKGKLFHVKSGSITFFEDI